MLVLLGIIPQVYGGEHLAHDYPCGHQHHSLVPGLLCCRQEGPANLHR